MKIPMRLLALALPTGSVAFMMFGTLLGCYGENRRASQDAKSSFFSENASAVEDVRDGKTAHEGRDGRGFTMLPSSETGIEHVNPIDTTHPLKRIYHSGFACGGVSVGDVNGDAKPDLFFVGGPGSNHLYCQTGDFAFRDQTRAAGVEGGDTWGTGAAMFDIDGDADLDIYVCNYKSPNQLFVNDGHGVFTEEAHERGLDIADASLMSAFCDYDCDGDLDVYVLTNRLYRPGGKPRQPPVAFQDGKPYILPEFQRYYGLRRVSDDRYEADVVGRPDYLLRNDGSGNFTDVTAEARIAGTDHGLSATWWDYDEDGWTDLYVGNDFRDPDRLWRNNGDGTFTDVTKEAVAHTTWFSMGADVADVNADGHLDLLIADMSGTNHYRQKTMMGVMGDNAWFLENATPRQYMRNALHLGTGTHRLREAAYLAGLDSSDWTWAVKLADFNNDGRVDVFCSTGNSRNSIDSDFAVPPEMYVGRTEWDIFEDRPPLQQQNLAFRNDGDLHFTDATESWGLDHIGMSYAAAWGDLDGDGDLDLVVTNLQEAVSVYRNDMPEKHWFQLQLRGRGKNVYGIGAKVIVRTRSGTQTCQLQPATGFLSCNQPIVHFGLADESYIESLTIRWPSGAVQTLHDVEVDRRHIIHEPLQSTASASAAASAGGLYSEQAEFFDGIRHQELSFDDYARQPLLPNKLSQLGPGIAWGDVDGDGDDDCYLGQAAGERGALLLREAERRFVPKACPSLDADSGCEDMGALFFDADADGDLDLYVVSGGVECSPNAQALRDRLYLNDGDGNFERSHEALPDIRDSGSVVAAADFDRDGDLDLFVGGRVIPGKYPLAPNSRLLRNDGGVFTDATSQAAPELLNSGLVTSAIWSDANDDGWTDLLVTHEWGPVKLYVNRQGILENRTKGAGLADLLGWWNGVASGDFDGDGDSDYVVTNFGLNTKYHASEEKPTLLYYGDFDHSGRMRLVEAEHEDDILFPVRGKSCSTSAMPHLGARFKTFHEFALASVDEIYTSECLESAHRFAVTVLESGVLINDGTAHFEFHPLPRIAQIAPAFGVCVCEANGDGISDVFIVQNFYSPQPETGRMAGGLSQLLLGNGDGSFNPVPPRESGLIVPGDAKSLVRCDLNNDGWPDFVIGVNDARPQAFVHRGKSENDVMRVVLRGPPENRLGIGAVVWLHFQDGAVQRREMQAGGGYLSQSAGELCFGVPSGAIPQKLLVRWPDASRQEIQPERDQQLIEVVYVAEDSLETAEHRQ